MRNKMNNFKICRICLSQNVRMHCITNTKLQETYEKLINLPLANINIYISDMACNICHSLLKTSHRMQQQCIMANNAAVQVCLEGTKPMINSSKLVNRLGYSQADYIEVIPEKNVIDNMKKEECMKFEEISQDVGLKERFCKKQRANISDRIIFEENVSQLDKINKPNYTEPAKHNNGAMPTKTQKLQIKKQKCKQQQRRLRDTIIFEDNTFQGDQNDVPDMMHKFDDNDKLKSTNPTYNKGIGKIMDNIEDLGTISSGTSYSCKICAYKSVTKDAIKKHLLVHTGEKPFSCNICTYKCKQEQHLSRHLLIHTGDKRFSCDICKYRCSQKSDLKRHIFSHTVDKPYSCNICMYKCTRKDHLRYHLLTHIGDKPFSCNICTYKCTRKSLLKSHLLTHVDSHARKKLSPSKYSCNICTYKCTKKFLLNNHLLAHSGNRLSCNICTFKCMRQSQLKIHLRTHAGFKPFSCTICSYICSYKHHLQSHMQTHTGIK